MSPEPRLPWRRLGAEFLVIVTGVLMALGVQALWDGRVERGDEREALSQILTDFRSNAARLDTVRAQDMHALRASYELRRLSLADTPAVSSDSVAALVFEFTDVWTYDPVLGGLNSLIASGQLNIIRSDSLRVALAAWPDIVENLHENEKLEWDYTALHIIPYLQESGSYAPILQAAGLLSEVPPTTAPQRLQAVLDDEYFLNLVATRIYNVEWLLGEMDTVDDGIQTIIRLIEGESGGS